jgi:hypothetical protein
VSRNRRMRPIRMVAGLLAGLLFAVVAVPVDAQTAPASHAGIGFGPVYDAAHETILSGTIQEVITRHEIGSPAGIRLLIAGPQGLVDTHLGPYLGRETKDALHAGVPVRIVGAMSSLYGREYLLARQLSVAGQTVTVRSEHGLLVRARSAPETNVRTENKTRKTFPVEQ